LGAQQKGEVTSIASAGEYNVKNLAKKTWAIPDKH
jgi:hypothetical protein